MNITYLIGAGASYPTLPLVDEFGKGLNEFSGAMNSNFPPRDTIDSNPSVSLLSVNKDFINEIDDIVKKSADHASIDTYAKKLFIRGDADSKLKLKKLKIVLSLFFSYRQSIPPPHYRHDSFFASILQNSIEDLPSNIKIVTWNYDSQFELAFGNFSGLRLEENQDRLGVNSKFRPHKIDLKKFSIIKINGTAAFRTFDKKNENYEYDSLFKGDTNQLSKYYSEKYFKAINTEDYHCELSFAWEDDNSPLRKSKIYEVANTSILNTDVLVVIGYSFPIFNRTIDKEILKNINIKRVYFQSKEPDQIMERFQSIRSDINERDLIPRNDVKQFLLPDELDLPDQPALFA